MADISTIFAAMKAALQSAYPSLDGRNPTVVLIKAKGAAEGGKVPQPGWTPGSAVPCFCLSEIEAETVDTSASFELVTLTYPILTEYVKSGAPESWNDDPDIRDKRLAIMNMFYRNSGVAGMPTNVFDVRYHPANVYESNEAANVVISPQRFVYTLHVPRPGVS